MFSKPPILALLLFSLAALPGCSSNGDWPSLSDKMPDPASRSRAVERADPSVAPRVQEQMPTTLTEAKVLLASVTEDIKAAQEAYTQALRAFDGSGTNKNSPNDDERVHLWLEAQLALTRLSQTASRLDVILFNENLADTELGGRSRTTKSRIDAQVVAARQSLAAQKPDTIS